MPAVVKPNLGLFFDRPPIDIPKQGLQDGKNFRCKNGTLEYRNMGWERFGTFALNGQVILIDNFFPRGMSEKLIFATTTDIYLYDPDSEDISFLTPSYSTGTATASVVTVTGTGTLWLANVTPSDEIMFGAANYDGVAPSGNDANTKVLLHFTDADASTTFGDNATGANAHTWTAAGNAQIDTAQFKFDLSSGLFDGTGDWVTTPDAADFTVGTNWTVDTWIRPAVDGTDLAVAGQMDVASAVATSAWDLLKTSANRVRFRLSNGSAFTTMTSSTTPIVAGAWYHVEVVKTGTALVMYINGVQEASATFSGTPVNATVALGVGNRGAENTAPFNGWIDEFRMSDVARHSANFTPRGEAYYTDWFNILSVNTDTSLTLSVAVGSPGANTASNLYTIRRKFSDTTGGQWATDVFFNAPGNEDLWFATNGIEPPITWDGVDQTVLLHPELGFTCTTLATFSNMMVYGNITEAGVTKPTSIINSDVGLPLNAGSTGTGLSEEFIVYNSADAILNLVPLGDYLVIYGARTIVPAQFVGDPLIFIFRVAIVGIGPISAYAIADFGDFHEFVGADAGYLFDGVTLKETNSHVWRDVLRQTDPARRLSTYVHFDEEQGDLIWSLPNNSDPGVGNEDAPPTVAWVEHYLEDVGQFDGSPFSKRDFPFTATGFYQRNQGLTWDEVTEQWQNFNFAWNDQFFQAAFPLNMGGMDDGTIWIINQSQTANGVPLPSFARTGRMVLSSGRERDLLTRIYPYARSQPYMLDVHLFMSDFVGGGMQDKGIQQFDQNLVEGQHFVVFYRRGRTMEFQFGSDAGDPWTLDGWDYDKVNGGRR